MSDSEPPPAAPFRVTSDPFVNITVYDTTRIARGHGEGKLDLSLPPGLYQLRFERCGSVDTRLVDHVYLTRLEHRGPPLRSPTPITGAATSHACYTEAARRFSVEDTGSPLGEAPHSARLFLLIRREDPKARPLLRLPSAPVTICDVAGRPLTTIIRDNALLHDDDGYVAFSCLVAPGTYRIHGGGRHVAITIPAGRAAHVFIPDPGSMRPDELRVSLVPLEVPFEPDSQILAAMESLIAALRAPGHRFPLAARRLILKVEDDLCFGIVAAHLLFRCGHFKAFAAVTERLARYRELPDVAILQCLQPRAEETVSLPALDAPPLLHASLVAALTRPQIISDAIAPTSAFAQAARACRHDSIWCTWSARPWDERWIEPSVESLRTQDRYQAAGALARRLALPPATVKHTLRALVSTPCPEAIPGYELHGILGRGARSTVFYATRTCDGQPVAVKVIPAPSLWVVRSATIVRIEVLSRLNCSHIIGPSAWGELPDGAGMWMQLERCRGNALDLLDGDFPCSTPVALGFMLQALQGLQRLHNRGIVHGGVRPENILIRRTGSVALADAGLATFPANQAHGASSAARFAAPELLQAISTPLPYNWNPPFVGFSSDVWSAAATAYFLLTSELPRTEYAGQSPLEAARDNPIVSITERRADLPPVLERIIDVALSPDPSQRPSTTGLSAALAQCLATLRENRYALAAGSSPMTSATAPSVLDATRRSVSGIRIVLDALQRWNWNIDKAAYELAMPRATLAELIRDLRLTRDDDS